MKVEITRKAKKFLLQLDDKRYSAVMEIVKHLEFDAVPRKVYDVTKISGTKTGYRIRKGKIRILYSIEKEKDEINVVKIEYKDDATYK